MKANNFLEIGIPQLYSIERMSPFKRYNLLMPHHWNMIFQYVTFFEARASLRMIFPSINDYIVYGNM